MSEKSKYKNLMHLLAFWKLLMVKKKKKSLFNFELFKLKLYQDLNLFIRKEKF